MAGGDAKNRSTTERMIVAAVDGLFGDDDAPSAGGAPASTETVDRIITRALTDFFGMVGEADRPIETFATTDSATGPSFVGPDALDSAAVAAATDESDADADAELSAARTRRGERLIMQLMQAVTQADPISTSDAAGLHETVLEQLVTILDGRAALAYGIGADGAFSVRMAHLSPRLVGEARPEGTKPVTEAELARRAEAIFARTVEHVPSLLGRAVTGGDDADVAAGLAELGELLGIPVHSTVTAAIAGRTAGDHDDDHEGDGATEARLAGALQLVGAVPLTEQNQAYLEEVAGFLAHVERRAADPDARPSEEDYATFIGWLARCETVRLDDVPNDQALLDEVGEEALREQLILPIARIEDGALRVAMWNPLDVDQRRWFEARTRTTIGEVVVCPRSSIVARLDAAFGAAAPGDESDESGGDPGERSAVAADEAPASATPPPVEPLELPGDASPGSDEVAAVVDRIIERGRDLGASDIHVEPFERAVAVRYRVDGVLRPVFRLPPGSAEPIGAHLASLASLGPSHGLPREGLIRPEALVGRLTIETDVRVTTSPMTWGEKIVLRPLPRAAGRLTLDELGLRREGVERYRHLIEHPSGLLVHAGPRGAGKRTALRAALAEIADVETNVHTAEDPVSVALPGVNQLSIRRELGLGWASALQSFLHQDADVIMIGEMADPETAELVCEAAIAGHLILSTLFVDHAAAVPVRLIEMGVDPYLVAASLIGAMGQRLMRRLCPECKREVEPTAETEAMLARTGGYDEPFAVFAPAGCDACGGSGYRGRIGVHEVMPITPGVRELILRSAPAEAIREAAIDAGMATMYRDAITKVRDGVTSLEEALANVRSDELGA